MCQSFVFWFCFFFLPVSARNRFSAFIPSSKSFYCSSNRNPKCSYNITSTQYNITVNDDPDKKRTTQQHTLVLLSTSQCKAPLWGRVGDPMGLPRGLHCINAPGMVAAFGDPKWQSSNSLLWCEGLAGEGGGGSEPNYASGDWGLCGLLKTQISKSPQIPVLGGKGGRALHSPLHHKASAELVTISIKTDLPTHMV